jgi:hypothetical protein
MNFNKGRVIITFVVTAFKYLWLPLFIFNIVCVNWIYQFYIRFYYCLHEDVNLSLKHGEFVFIDDL